MNLLLILREELVCLGILIYLLIYSHKFVSEERFFLRLNGFAIGHIVFDLITVITVNSLKNVPLWVNTVCHIIFYVFAILYCCELFRYVLKMVYGKKNQKMGLWVYAVPFFYAALIPFFSIEYLQGNGTNYSYGQSVIIGYVLAMAFFFASEIILLLHLKNVPANAKKSLIPSFIFMTIAVITQIFIPELLFTGADVTLVTGGVFFAIVNPMEKYREKAFMDTAFGVKNRNAYVEETKALLKMPLGILAERNLTVVIFDMNGLKQVNDNYGHAAGDKYLQTLTDILKKELKGAMEIYRMGGDEFHALYLNVPESQIISELRSVTKCCAEADMGYSRPLSVSYGWASLREEEPFGVLEQRADRNMFEAKRKLYETPDFDRRKRRTGSINGYKTRQSIS